MIEERNGLQYDPAYDVVPQDYFKIYPQDPGRVKILAYGLYDYLADAFVLDWCYNPSYEGKSAMMVYFMGYHEFARRWQDWQGGFINHVTDGFDPEPAFFEEGEAYFSKNIELLADYEANGWFTEDSDWRPV